MSPDININDLMEIIERVRNVEEIILKSKDTRETGALSAARIIIKNNLEIALNGGYQNHETYGEKIRKYCVEYGIPL